MKDYLYRLLHKYVSVYIRQDDSFIELFPQHHRLFDAFLNKCKATFVKSSEESDDAKVEKLTSWEQIRQWKPDYILLNGNIHYESDIQRLMENVRRVCTTNARVIIIYYSSLWMPLAKMASWLGWRDKMPEQNWIAHEDIDNILSISGFEPIRVDQRVLLPIYIPFLSDFFNRYLAPLPFFRLFTLLNVLVARPYYNKRSEDSRKRSVSIIVPARNEAGNIENAILRIPKMGAQDEVIFVEGHSTDNTWATIQEVADRYGQNVNIKIAQQDGNGKGDAVRKGFSLASNDILMILDADLTVPPEDLVKFYRAITSGKGEFINGSRLVYPVEDEAMRFFNTLGNKVFAVAFSFVLGQRFKDTLCGTKVLSRKDYFKIAHHRSYFGEFDPFGDFDLLFGACRLGLKIVEVPVAYKKRIYGDTNIHRWKHGVLLFKMLIFAARKIKFI